jgi:hypothetical protein
MAITVKHLKTSAIPDAGDTTLVQPSDWNADHTLTGTVPVANGGTGAATANDGFNALAPSQTGNNGKYLTTDGTNSSWSVNPLGTVTSVAATVPAFLSVSGSPITTSGTLALTYSGTALPVANGGTARTVGNYSVFANEIHVSKDGNDTTGDGTLINPVLTITKALTLIAGLKKTVIVHAGDYPESPTVSTANTTIATSELTGANTTITGTLTLSAAARVSGIKISNLTITGSGNTYISNCTVDTQVVKSGTNYVEIINSELQCVSGIQITGAGTVSIVGNKCWGVTVSNASANVLIKDCFQVLTPSVTAGNLQIDGSAIFAASPASNAVTSSVGSFITLANSFILNSAGTNVERVSLAGFYSILNLVYDKTNSTFAGTNLNAVDYFSVINADTLVLTNDLAIAYGGTNSSATPTAGAVPYGTGTAYAFSAAGTAGQVLTSQGAGTPTWTTPTTGTVTSVAATAGTGISVTGSPITTSGTLNITNTAPDQTVVLTAGTGISTSGTYPNFTITNTSPSSGGTVTSVTGTAPVVSSGGNTPAISMPAATTSVNGYLTSTDWNTFNGKSNTNGTVTSVAALTLGTTGTDLSSTVATGTTTPVITLQVPTASATNRGALSAADWTTFNGKAASFTYTSTYIPYGQGTTTPNQNANFTFDGTTQTAPVQRASNGIITNSNTVSSSYTIPATDNAVSAGPITVASGQSVTVSSGSRWVVL